MRIPIRYGNPWRRFVVREIWVSIADRDVLRALLTH